MNTLVDAALSGPELKKAKIKDPQSGNEHEFNIKAVTYRADGQQLLVQGQLSHCLKGQPDDQLWYAFAKKGNHVEPGDASKMIVRRKEGGIAKYIGDLADLSKFAESYVPDAVTTLVKILNDHKSLLRRGEGWERAAESLILAIAAQASTPSAAGISTLELFEHNGLKGKKTEIATKKDVADTKTIQMNDTISSLRAVVPNGTTLRLFEHANFGGKYFEIGPGLCIIGDLEIHDFGDCISSIRWQSS